MPTPTPTDTQPPVITITSPQSDSVVPGPPVTVSGTASDEGQGATGVRQVLVNGREAAYDPTTRGWMMPSVALDEGPNTITVAALDNATPPNRGEAAITVTRRTPDTQKPTVQNLTLKSPIGDHKRLTTSWL